MNTPWDKIQKRGKRIELYANIIQGSNEFFTDFFFKLNKSLNIIESLAFENANTKCKKN